MKSSRLNAHLKAAKAYAELSHARRLRVGCVLIMEDRVFSIGYNGMPSGMDNDCEDEVDGVLITKPGLVHAEMNAVAFAAKYGLPTKGCIMVITHSPCYECSKLLVQAGVKEVYYEEEYRLIESLDFLRDNNVKVGKIDEKKTRQTIPSKGTEKRVSTGGDVQVDPQETNQER